MRRARRARETGCAGVQPLASRVARMNESMGVLTQSDFSTRGIGGRTTGAIDHNSARALATAGSAANAAGDATANNSKPAAAHPVRLPRGIESIGQRKLEPADGLLSINMAG